ncbi:MAG TPA: cytochrome c [Puia sp.]|nr:cytochrome c [Puia sp.]
MKKNKVFFVLTGSLFVLATVLMSQTTKPAATKSGTAAKPASAAPGGLAASITRGKQVYLEQCLACHQADALGVSGMNPPLVKTKFVLGDKTTLVKIVLNGMTGTEIEGEEYHGVMASHSDLTDQQIADVLTYVRNSFGNKAAAVKASEVKAIRAMNKPAQ